MIWIDVLLGIDDLDGTCLANFANGVIVFLQIVRPSAELS
jgi:hypothetical protein